MIKNDEISSLSWTVLKTVRRLYDLGGYDSNQSLLVTIGAASRGK